MSKKFSKSAPTATTVSQPQAESDHRGGPGDMAPSEGNNFRVLGGYDNFGISGLSRYGGVSRVYEEFLRELQGPQGMKAYREMTDNCPIVGAILFAAQHLCRKVSVGFKPANSSNEAKRVADVMGQAIFEDMDMTWPDVLSEILTMLPFGWALMEFRLKKRSGMRDINLRPPNLERNTLAGDGNGIGYSTPTFAPSKYNDGLIGFRSWSLRSQETLFMWEFDIDSNAVVMQQMAPPDYGIRRIPLTKSLLFRTQVSKNNPEGRSVLRNAWTSYYMKKNLQIFEGIGIERDLAGYPMIQIAKPEPDKGLNVPDIWNSKDPAMVAMLANMQKIVRSVRVDEQMGLVMPWWAEFTLVNGGSRRRVDTNSIIARYDQRIAMSMMADFIMLGHEAVGSKALASTKISLFTSALSSFLDVIGAIIDRRAVRVLMEVNGFPDELTPTFYHGDVESVNLEELGDFIQKVSGTGFNPLGTYDAQKAAMHAAHLPTTGLDGKLTLPVKPGVDADPDTRAAAAAQAAAAVAGQKPGKKPGKSLANNDSNDADDNDSGEDTPVGSEGGPVAPASAAMGQPDDLNIS